MSDEEQLQENRFSVGYRVVNPEAPPEERRFEPINPELQAKAEKIFWQIRDEALAMGK